MSEQLPPIRLLHNLISIIHLSYRFRCIWSNIVENCRA